MFDDPRSGGDLGYRALRHVTTPVDRPCPPAVIEAPDASLMHDIYRVFYYLSLSVL